MVIKFTHGLVYSLYLMTTFGLFLASAYGFYYDNPAEEAFTKTKFELFTHR